MSPTSESLAALHQAIDSGVNFIDTADVYGDGRSERLIAQLKRDAQRRNHRRHQSRTPPAQADRRRLQPRKSQRVDRPTACKISPPTASIWCNCTARRPIVYYRAEVFGMLDDLVKAGKIRYYGVSVEKVEEALKAIEYPNVQTVQIIFNCFRQRPAELSFPRPKQKRVGILARVPLASGMLTGKLTRGFAIRHRRPPQLQPPRRSISMWAKPSPAWITTPASKPSRKFARWFRQATSMTQFALRWILMFDAVTCAIPGGKRPEQVAENCKASDLPGIPMEVMQKVKGIYDARVKGMVHGRW